ncbi:MAG: class I SAM-dependent methyltransferase [Phycisphaerales bacterium]|jgi:SAM-dependent methyltransferase|nr:class I SAM-dependent methyltransferase [Phycisphaerales bacterium]
MLKECFKWWLSGDGFLRRFTGGVSDRMRNQRFKAFVGAVAPRAEDRVLDVGVSGQVGGSVNHFERVYPWPDMLTACGLEGEPEICVQRGIKFACADALALPFDDASFDIVYCNAVIEHVGSRARQGKLISELLRVGKRVFLATPDAASPMESHTLIPLAHWLPQKMCHAIYRLAGRGYFATEDNLNLLDVGQLLSLLPREIRHRTMIRRQYLMGMPAVITVTVGPKI